MTESDFTRGWAAYCEDTFAFQLLLLGRSVADPPAAGCYESGNQSQQRSASNIVFAIKIVLLQGVAAYPSVPFLGKPLVIYMVLCNLLA